MDSLYQSNLGRESDLDRRLTKNALIILEASIRIATKLNQDRIQARDAFGHYTFRGTKYEHLCQPIPKCKKKSKYRSIDGRCNNLKHPTWGMSHTDMIRLLPSAYADGLNELRRSQNEEELPSARLVSATAALDKNLPHRKFNLAVMQWGQFLDHDLTLALSTTLDIEEHFGILCCVNNPTQDMRTAFPEHPACKPIDVPEDDRFYSRHEVKCLNFVRNAPGPRPNCNLGPREQSNMLTATMDGSMIYGSDEESARELRTNHNGMLHGR